MNNNKSFKKNVRHLVVASVVLLLSACSPTSLPVNALQADFDNTPSWAKQKPASGTYYIGVGYSNKSDSDNYTQAAKKNALDDLISEISVTLSSVSVLNQMESDEGFSEQYESMIKTSVSNEIEDYELVDAWDDEARYWVYYRLSKAEYKRQQEEKRRNAITLARDHYQKGKNAITNGEITSGLSMLVSGIYTLAPYLSQRNEVEIDGENVLLGNALYQEAQRALDDIELSSDNSQIKVSMRLDEDQPIGVKVRTNSGAGVAELPLRAGFTLGDGNLKSEYTTNSGGDATILVSSIKSKENRQVITISPDISRLENNEENKKKYGLLLKALKVPSLDLNLSVTKPIVYLETSEKILGQQASGRMIEAKVKEVLTQEGFTLGRIKEKADLWVEVLVDTQEGRASGSIYTTYLNLTINVIDMQTGVEVNHASIDRLKAYSLDYQRSSVSGYEKAAEVLEEETLPKLINEMLQ